MLVLVLYRIGDCGRIGRVKLEVLTETHGDGKLLKAVRGADFSRGSFIRVTRGLVWFAGRN